MMGSFQCLLYTQILMTIAAEASCDVTNLLLHYEGVKDEKIRRQDQNLKATDSSDWNQSNAFPSFHSQSQLLQFHCVLIFKAV